MKDLKGDSKQNIQDNVNKCTDWYLVDVKAKNGYQSQPIRFPSEGYDDLKIAWSRVEGRPRVLTTRKW